MIIPGIIQDQIQIAPAVPTWVYITYSSSEIIGDINLDASQDVDGISEAQAFLESYYPAAEQGYGDTGVVLDINLIYIEFECQPV